MATIFTSTITGKEVKIEFQAMKYDLYAVGKDGVAKKPTQEKVADNTGRFIGYSRPLNTNREWEQEVSVVQSDAVEEATGYNALETIKKHFLIDGSYETEDK